MIVASLNSASARWACVVLIVFSLTAASEAPVFGQERKGDVLIVGMTGDGKLALKKARSVAVLLSGNDPTMTRLLEDALAIHLTNSGIAVFTRLQIERASAEQPAPGKADKADSIPSFADLGRRLGADSIMMGTLLVGLSEQQRTIQIRLVTFEVADSQSGAALIRVLFEFDKGKSIPEVAEGFVKVVNDARK